MPDGTSSTLHEVKISELPVAPAANATDQLEANQAGTSRSITLDQVATVVAASDQIADRIGADLPEHFGAAGDGVTIDDAAIIAWLNYCAANGVKAVTTPGKTYKLSDTFSAYIRTDFDGTNSEFITSNNGQTLQVFTIDSQTADIEDITATLPTWTNLYRGSRSIPQLAGQRGWSYNFNYTNATYFLLRSTTGSIAKGEAFQVVDNQGTLSKQLATDYTLPLANVTGSRRRIRYNMEVRGLVIRLTTGSVNRNRFIYVVRPNTTLVNCILRNETTTTVDQGYVHTFTTQILYDRCRVEGLTPNYTTTLNYGWNGSYADDITFRNCYGSECRRDIDSHGCSNYKVDGGVFTDGIGGHWLNGLHVYGNAFLSNQHPNNPNPIQIAGSDVNIESAHIYCKPTANTSAVVGMRADFPELRGLCRLGPDVVITIDFSTYTAWANSTAYTTDDVRLDTSLGTPWRCLVNHTSATSPTTFAADRAANPTFWQAYASERALMYFPNDYYDCGRAVYLPSTIDCRPGLVQQLGATSANPIGLVAMQLNTAAQFPQNINMPLQITVEPGAFDLAAGYVNGVSTRLYVGLRKSDKSIGDYCKVRIAGVRRVAVLTSAASAACNTAVGRFDLEVSGIIDNLASQQIGVAYGVVRRAYIERCDPAILVNISGAVGTPLGDEKVQWGGYTENNSYTPTLTGVTNITSVLPLTCFYTVTREGPQTHVEVFGQFSSAATLAANTATALGISLPPGVAPPGFTVVNQMSGSAVTTNGTLSASINADVTNQRATMSWLSNAATPTNTHFIGRFRYRVA